MDEFADFGWIFLQLGLHSLGFLDEVSKFLQLLFILLMFMMKLLFYCKKSCLVKPKERNISASSSHKVIFV